MTTSAKARHRLTSVRDGLCGDSCIAAVEAGLGFGALDLSEATLGVVEARPHPAGRLHRVHRLMPEGNAMHRETAFGTSFGPQVSDSQLLSTAVL